MSLQSALSFVLPLFLLFVGSTSCGAMSHSHDDIGDGGRDSGNRDADRDSADAADSDIDPVGCRFTGEGDSGAYECFVPFDSEETCLDAGRCFCEGNHPGGSDEEINRCMAEIILPRAMITLSDYCGNSSSMSLAEALESWLGETFVFEPGCDEIPATFEH